MKLEELTIPDEYKITTNGEPFLLYESFSKNIEEKRILIFSTEKNVNLLLESKHWFVDGTFSYCPSLFVQLYTIHSIIACNIVPLVYILLPNKKEITYRRMFLALNILKPN
jgi:hypothetical protein